MNDLLKDEWVSGWDQPETQPDNEWVSGWVMDEEPEPEKSGALETIGKGLTHGTLGLAESIGTGVEYLGNRIDSEGVANVGREAKQYWGDKADKFTPSDEIYGKNVWDNPEILKNSEYWLYNISDMVPMLAASVIPGAAAAKGIQAVTAIPKLAKIGGAIIGGATGGSIEGSQTYNAVLEKGGTEEEAARAAELMTVGSGVLNALSVGKILSKAGNGFKAKVVKHLGAGAWEGITEGLEEPTEVFSKYFGAYLAGEELPQDIKQQLIDSAKDALTVAPIAAVTGVGGSVVSGNNTSPEDALSKDPNKIDIAKAADEKNKDDIERAANGEDISDITPFVDIGEQAKNLSPIVEDLQTKREALDTKIENDEFDAEFERRKRQTSKVADVTEQVDEAEALINTYKNSTDYKTRTDTQRQIEALFSPGTPFNEGLEELEANISEFRRLKSREKSVQALENRNSRISNPDIAQQELAEKEAQEDNEYWDKVESDILEQRKDAKGKAQVEVDLRNRQTLNTKLADSIQAKRDALDWTIDIENQRRKANEKIPAKPIKPKDEIQQRIEDIEEWGNRKVDIPKTDQSGFEELETNENYWKEQERKIKNQKKEAPATKINQARINANLSDVELEDRDMNQALAGKSDFLQKLDMMQTEVNSTQTGGINQQKANQEGEDVRFSSDSPQWMRQLQKERKADKKPLLGRKDLNTLFDKIRSGKPLTVRQQGQYDYLEKAINDYTGESAEFIEQEKADMLEKDGFDVLGGQNVSVANLNEGDKFVGTVDGVKDEFTVKDTNAEGETLLQDGIAKRVDMFDEVSVEGIKRNKLEKSQKNNIIEEGKPQYNRTLFNADPRQEKQLDLFPISRSGKISRSSSPKKGKKDQAKTSTSAGKRLAAKVRVDVRTTGNIKHSGLAVKSDKDAASLLSHLADNTNEALYTIIVDKNGEVLEVFYYSKGGISSSTANASEIAGRSFTHNNIGKTYIVHNHPAGSTDPSISDKNLVKSLEGLFRLRKIPISNIIIGKDIDHKKRWGKFESSGQIALNQPIPKTIKKVSIPVKERVYAKDERGEVVTPQNINKILKGKPSGFILVDRKLHESGYLEFQPGMPEKAVASEVLEALETTNSTAIIPYNKEGHIEERNKFFVKLSKSLRGVGKDVAVIVTDKNGKRSESVLPGEEIGNISDVDSNKPVFSTTQDFDQTETKAFRKWSKGYEVLNGYEIADAKPGQGYVFKVHHGTTNGFNIFDPTVKGTKEGQFGQVNYFTSDIGDANNNYAGNGPDLTNRIKLRKERIENELDEYDEDEILELSKKFNLPFDSETETYPDGLPEALAKEELQGDDTHTKTVYVRLDNPIYVGGNTQTWIENQDTEQYREDATEEVLSENDADKSQIDEYENEIQERILDMAAYDKPEILVAIQEAIREIETDADPNKTYEQLEIYDTDISATELEERLMASEELMYAEDFDGEGELIQSHLIGQIFKHLGFDGIVLQNADKRFKTMDMGSGIAHVHVFEETPANIKSATDNTGSFDPINPDIRYSKDALPGQGISIQDIQSRFKNQQVFLSPDGSISIKLKNGKGLRIKSVQDMGDGDTQYAIESGRMGKDGLILGKYLNNTITLNKDLANNFTRDHELFHFLIANGMITKTDKFVLTSKYNALKNRNQLNFKPNESKEENLANTFAQILEARESYRNTTVGRIVQKISDFIDGLLHIGRMSTRKLARQVESGKVFSLEGSNANKVKPQFQTTSDLAQDSPVTNQDYIENRKQHKDIKLKTAITLKKITRDITRGVDKFLGSVSTRLKTVSPKLAAKVRTLDFDINTKAANDLKTVLPLLRKAKNMTRDDYADWDYARKNSDKEKLDELNKKYGIEKEYKAVRKMLDRIREEAIDVGYEVGEIEEYWPRVLKDQEGFLRAIDRGPERPEFTDALKKKAKDMGIEVWEMDPTLRADIISNVILGKYYGIPGPGSVKQRVFKKIPVEFNKFYMDSDAALTNHIHSMRKRIEARRFFGKVPDRIATAKTRLRTAEARLRKLNPDQKDKIADVKDNIQQYRIIIEKYKHQNDFEENIGAYIGELIAKREITPSDEKVVKDILTARFNEHGTRGVIQAYKNLSYIDTMGSVTSAITQVGDLAWAAYEGGLIPALKNAYKSARGKSRITKEDVGVERIAQEFSDGDTLSKAVSAVFKIVGLEKMDSIGKEALLNTAFEKYKRQAKKNPAALRAKIRPIFGKETDSVINDLLNDDITENVRLLVFHRLLDFQPVTLSEMPEKYLTAGNGRLFYMLKTFTIKQFDVYRKEVYQGLRHGDKAQKIQAMKNLVSLTAMFVLANAGADELKDWLLGRNTDLEDRVVDNLLRLFGVSKFVTWKARTEGAGSAMARQILPPFKFIDAATKDIVTAGDDKGLYTPASIPVVGKLAYWHMGRGQRSKGDRWDRKFSKEKRRLNEVKEQFDRSKNKLKFRVDHKKEFAALKKTKKIQGRLNKYRKRINKLKALPQSKNTEGIIRNLENKRSALIMKYFGRSLK